MTSDHSNGSFLAIDLGATSGRAIIATLDHNIVSTEEIIRFSNPIVNVRGRIHWDLFYLYNKILQAISISHQRGIKLISVGIDTWGVDFACFASDGQMLRMPYSYRDQMTVDAPKRYFGIMPRETVYRKTGIQILNFNTLFQLALMREENRALYELTDKILFLPDALSYMLTGRMVTEYTIASTSQLIDPRRKKFDESLLRSIGLTTSHFASIVPSATTIGNILPVVQQLTGVEQLKVVAVAGHDTASAVLATPASNNRFAYLSSGTWSLMGVEVDYPVISEKSLAMNFTNEGGADGSTRLLKNICGMWLIEQCRREWKSESNISYSNIIAQAEDSKPFKCFINPDSPCFVNPPSMTEAICNYCIKTGQKAPQTIGEFARCIYESLAFRYKQTLDDLFDLTGMTIDALHIIGGGSQNSLLNQYAANATGKTVIAGPSEATALGNVMLQAKAAGLVSSKSDMRRIIENSVDTKTFSPNGISKWQREYERYLKAFDEI